MLKRLWGWVKTNPISIVTAGFLCLVAFWFRRTDYWDSILWSKWFVACVGLSIYFSIIQGMKIHWSTIPVICYVLISGLVVFSWRNTYAYLGNNNKLAIDFFSSYATVSFMLLLVFVSSIRKDVLIHIQKVFAFICLSESAIVLYQSFYYPAPEDRGGTLGNPSLTGCLISVLFPFCFSRKYWWISILPCAAIIASLSTMPVMGFIAACGTMVLFKIGPTVGSRFLKWFGKLSDTTKAFWTWDLMLISILVGIVLGSALALQNDNNNFFDSSGRLSVWKLAMKNLWAAKFQWHGMGSGTCVPLLAIMQIQDIPGHKGLVNLFQWLHSDTLQIILEYGIIGFSLSVLPLGFAIKNGIKRDPKILASLAAYSTVAMANYPMHLPFHAIVGCLVFRMCFIEGL